MKEIRLEINLDVKDDANIEDIIRLIKWASNVHGVIRVQVVKEVK